MVSATVRLNCIGQEPDWWKSQHDLTTLLLVSNTPIATLVRTVSALPEPDGPAAMFKVCLLMRAGMNGQATGAPHERQNA